MIGTLLTQEDIRAAFRVPDYSRLWAYIRVSDSTHEDNESPEVQRDSILAYCKKKKLGSPIFVYEKASAAKPLFPTRLPGMAADSEPDANPRPLFSLMLSCLCDKRHGKLLVWKLDRLSRVANEQELIIGMLERYDVELHVAYESESSLLEGKDPIRVLMRQILASFAQYERQMIVMRTKMGAAMKASKGGWIGGRRPYGYAVKDGDLVINPEEAEIVRIIFAMRARSYIPVKSISDYLTSKGLKGWYRSRVVRVIDNQLLYRGIYIDPYTKAEHPRPDLRILGEPAAEITDEDIPVSAPTTGLPEYDGP